MSLAKDVPDSLKSHKCKKMALCECPLIPYVPKKDSVQETVSAFEDCHLNMLINEGMELRVPIWHSGMHKAFLIHVGSTWEAIKKNGYFKSYEESSKSYAEQCSKIKQLKSQLSALDETSGQTGTSQKIQQQIQLDYGWSQFYELNPVCRHNGWA